MATASTYQLPPPPALWSLQSARFHQMMLLGWMTMTIGCLRGSISMVIVCMITRAESAVLAVNESTTEAPWHRFFHRNHNTDLYAISLSVPEQSTIHSTYYFATLIGLFLSHFLIGRFHAKRILTFGLLLNSTGSILMPFLLIALPNWLTIVIVRALMGFGNGFVTPCSVYIVAKWFPSHEKITAITALFIGQSRKYGGVEEVSTCVPGLLHYILDALIQLTTDASTCFVEFGQHSFRLADARCYQYDVISKAQMV
ncbi:hypothetical protein RB195_005459 [Necator americanus]|uniref:Major facilitator superfamily (MFS) profile domain-containing protein n=1 Tax=Necator americanus TaxID=51031 RepID=A0ABR1BQY2_NECAM